MMRTTKNRSWRKYVVACVMLLTVFLCFPKSVQADDGEISKVYLKVQHDGSDVSIHVNGNRPYYISEVIRTEGNMEPGTTNYQTIRIEADSGHYFKEKPYESYFSITNGDYYSSSNRNGAIVLKYAFVAGGVLEEPEDVRWSGTNKTIAKWHRVDGAMEYEYRLYENGIKIASARRIYDNQIDFSSKMKRGNDYYFEVKARSSLDYVKNSDWASSEEVRRKYDKPTREEEEKNQHSGPGASSNWIDWRQQGNKWYGYIGNRQQYGWCQNRDGIWYYFDKGSGVMKTGFIWDNGKKYYLNPSGAMLTGWIYANNNWYYAQSDGSLVKNAEYFVEQRRYLFNSDGVMCVGWIKNYNGTYSYYYQDYKYDQYGNILRKWGEKAVDEWVDGFYVDANGNWRR